MLCQGSNPMGHLQGKHSTSCTIALAFAQVSVTFLFLPLLELDREMELDAFATTVHF